MQDNTRMGTVGGQLTNARARYIDVQGFPDIFKALYMDVIYKWAFTVGVYTKENKVLSTLTNLPHMAHCT